MKPLFTLLLLLSLNSGAVIGQSIDRHWWHTHQSKAQWFSQDDVFVFETQHNTPILYPQSMTWVQSASQESDWNGLHIVRFQPGATQIQKDQTKDDIRNFPDFTCELEVITAHPNDDHSQNKWRVANDLVMVTFYDPEPSQAMIDSFTTRWGLSLDVAPSPDLPTGYQWPYIFRNIHPERCGSRKAIDIAREIMEEDHALVEFAEPNILNLLSPFSNDPQYDQLWQIENTGQLLNDTISGSANADCNFKEAWNLGYTGAGINIAVIDFHGFDTAHEDMQGTYIAGLNAIDQSIGVFDQTLENLSYSHGHSVAGIIGARKDNFTGISGVVPDARIGAYLIHGHPEQVVNCLYHMLNPFTPTYDIINFSFGTQDTLDEGLQTMHLMIKNHRDIGRFGRGTVMIGAAGNDNFVGIRFPAAFKEVISITATTPSDSLKTYFDRWDILSGGQWGANYGKGVDFGAPGVGLLTTDLRDTLGSDSGNYHRFSGTSAAAPVACGVAAIILQADSSLPSEGPGSVFEYLRSGSDQVGGYYYNAFWPSSPGKSEEIGYGRLNALNSLNLVGLDEEIAEFRANFRIAHLTSGEIRAYYDISRYPGEFTLELIDLNGRVLARHDVPSSQRWLRIPTDGLSRGIYLARISSVASSTGSSPQHLTSTEKFTVLR